MGKIRVDKVALVGALIGIVSFAVGFLVLRPNRLASGTVFYAWQALSTYQFSLLSISWITALLLAILNQRKRSFFFITGLLGNLIIVFVFFFLGDSAGHLMVRETQAARVSIGIGAWSMVFAAYVLILASLQNLSKEHLLRLIVSMSGLVVLAVGVILGQFSDLSIMKEYLIRQDRFSSELFIHFMLAGGAVTIAVVLGIPLGIWAFRQRFLEKPIFFIVNMFQTIPSLALFGLMIAPLSLLSNRFPLLRDLGIQGIGWAPALIALTLYALLPIVRNMYVSLKTIDPAIVEAGIGMGMSGWQLLKRVQIPLALSVVLSGIRTSMVQATGNTTVAALIGAGGLGVFVFQGLGQAVPDLILLGALPVIVLAVLIDRSMQVFIKLVTPKGLSGEF